MDVFSCNQCWQELQQTIADASLSLSAQAQAHVVGCEACKTRILALFMLLNPVHATKTSCTECQADLAVFVDLEQADVVEALRSLPHVWIHLWSCKSCRETYTLMLEWQASFPLHMFKPAPDSRHNTAQTLFAYTTVLIRNIFPSMQAATAAYRSGYVAAEKYELLPPLTVPQLDAELTLLIQFAEPTHMFATLAPARAGELLLKLADQVYVAPLIEGTATFTVDPEKVFAVDAPFEVAYLPPY